MKKRLLSLLLLCTLVFALSGCGEKTLLNKKKPVSLSFWHVYGEQAGSPMDLLVQEFNRTVGQERGVQVQVTGMSSASQIGGYLKDAQSGGKDVQEMPDLFTCHIVDALELGEEDVPLSVSGQYVRRILDNITSNLLKYADPDRDIVVRFVQEESRAGLCFENCVLPVPASSESTKVGLPSIETMMEKMQGVCRIEQPEGIFRMTLLFKTAKE